MTHEREITAAVDLCRPGGWLNPDAVGWTRGPLHRANLRRGLGWWGRTKRWEYWGVVTPTHCIGVVVSSLDYAGVHGLYVLDRATGQEWVREVTAPLAPKVLLPPRPGRGLVTGAWGGLSIEIFQDASGSFLTARTPGIALDLDIPLPPRHESLGVVVPWSATRFQYTLKDVARPVSGTLTLDGVPHDVPAGESYAVLDHGRGRWPRTISWNWAAGSGPAGVPGVAQGLQLGAQWTDGTGSTENAVLVDGVLHKLGVDLSVEVDPSDRLLPWRMHGARGDERVDVTLTPFHERVAGIELGIVGSRTHQCFGTWSGTVTTAAGTWSVDGLVGWIEECHQRW